MSTKLKAGTATSGAVIDADTTGILELQSGSTPTTAVTVDASQNVGIGTASPTTKLDVGNGNFTISNSSNAPFVNFVDNTTRTQSLSRITMDQVSGTAGQLLFSTATGGTLSERMRIDSSGTLLVGTTTGSNTNGVTISKGGAAGGGIVQLLKTASGLTNGLLNYYGTTYVGGINFDNTSTSFPTSSDVRLKKDIVDAPSAIDKVKNIRIVSHGWKHDDAVVEYGVIAQELIDVAPQSILKGDDGEEVVTTWTVDYSKLVPILTKAIQEQQALITDLTTRLSALEAK